MRAVSLILVSVIPSPLSRRALDEVVAYFDWTNGGHAAILPIFSMVDHRRALHCAAARDHPSWPIIPMASAIEQMTVRRAPVGSFVPCTPAADAFAAL